MGDRPQEVGGWRETGKAAGVWVEVGRQLTIAWPMILTNLVAYAIIVLSIMFVGHLGELELSSASFANSLASITGFTVMQGLGSALETLCGQAFGAKSYHLLGTYLQAAVAVLVLIGMPITVLWWNMDTVLIWLGQDPTIATMAGLYLRTLTPALFAAAITQPLIKYLQTQSVVLPMMVCSVITFLIHIPISYLLVYEASFGGFCGGAIAVDISYWILLLQLIGYTVWKTRASEGHKTWNGFSGDALSLIFPFLRLAIPSTLMLCVQFWAFELLTFLSGLLPNPERELSFLSIFLNTAGLLFTIPFGLSAAASTRVSNELGAHNPRAAKSAMNVVLGLSTVQVTIIATCILLFGKLWIMAFSDEEEVIEYTSSAMPLLALSTVFDGIQGVLSGVARGCGRQDLCATMNIISVYGVGLPTAIILGFVCKLGAKGLFIGSLSGLGTYTCCLLVIILRTNWVKTVEEVQDRASDSQEPLLLPE
ncbi:unnamed protein product [Calypogeia fissa]